MRGHYIDGPFGQVHVSMWGETSELAPLICLPPAPFSGHAYKSLAPLLSSKRQVIAVDYPGYGNSSACGQAATISDYAHAVIAVADELATTGAILVGFHTGCLVATETARLMRQKIDHLILIDSPFFEPKKQREMLATMAAPVDLKPKLAMLEKPWHFCVSKFATKIPLKRAYDMFVDHIRAGENTNLAFAAAFQYPCKAAFGELTQSCTVIATGAGLYAETLNTAAAIQHATLIELTKLESAVLEQGAPTLAKAINSVVATLATHGEDRINQG